MWGRLERQAGVSTRIPSRVIAQLKFEAMSSAQKPEWRAKNEVWPTEMALEGNSHTPPKVETGCGGQVVWIVEMSRVF